MGHDITNAGRRNVQRAVGTAIAVRHPLHATRVAWCLRCRASTTQQVTTTVISEAAVQRTVRCEHCGSDIENTIQPLRAPGGRSKRFVRARNKENRF